MSNYFLLEPSASNRTTCSHCSKLIQFGSLRAKKKTQISHLRCFRPPLPSPIIVSKHIRLKNVDKPTDLAKVHRWVEKWNARFVVTEKDLPEKYTSKSVATYASPQKRVLMAIFAYLSVKSLETTVAFVSKSWFHVCRDNELWKSRYISEFSPDATEADTCYRSKYITLELNACWHCKKRVTLDRIRRRCAYYKRPLCTTCAWQRECRITPIEVFLAYKRIQPSLAKTLKFPHFRDNKRQSSYVHLLSDIMTPYAESRRSRLISLLSEERFRDKVTPEVLTEIQSYNLAKFYSEDGVSWDKISRPLTFFCGRDDTCENIDKTMTVFFESLG